MPSSGIEKLETDTFKLQSFQTLTGVKFVITAEAGTPDLGAVLQEIYELYTDYVLKVWTYKLARRRALEKCLPTISRYIAMQFRQTKYLSNPPKLGNLKASPDWQH